MERALTDPTDSWLKYFDVESSRSMDVLTCWNRLRLLAASRYFMRHRFYLLIDIFVYIVRIRSRLILFFFFFRNGEKINGINANKFGFKHVLRLKV